MAKKPKTPKTKEELLFLQQFTDPYIQALPIEAEMYQRREGRGFGVRVLPTGTKIWIYTYTLRGKRRQMKLGHYTEAGRPDHISLADALKKYKAAYDLVLTGIDPQAAPPTLPVSVIEDDEDDLDNMTVVQLVEKYKKHITINLVPKSVYDQYRTLITDVVPSWGTKLVKDVRRRDAIKLLEDKAATAPGQARNVMKTAKTMFGYALRRQYTEVNPFLSTSDDVPTIKPKKRSRFLDEKEIRFVWNKMYSKKNITFIDRILLLTLTTGQRPGEVAGMEWTEIDFGVGKPLCKTCLRPCAWWTIPPQKIKTECHKDNPDPKPFRVHLSPLAVSLLPDQSPELRDCGIHWVFPSDEDLPTRVTSLSHYTRLSFKSMTDWSPHDLRRTWASHLPAIGCTQEYIDRLQNHVIAGSGGTYNRFEYDPQKRAWETLWSLRLQEIVA